MIPPKQNSGFVANMEQVLDMYKKPYNNEFPVVCINESPKQLIEDGKPSIAVKPGQEARVDYEYIRHVRKIADNWYSEATKITLVMDNYNTHAASSFYKTFEPAETKRLCDRFAFIYTPDLDRKIINQLKMQQNTKQHVK